MRFNCYIKNVFLKIIFKLFEIVRSLKLCLYINKGSKKKLLVEISIVHFFFKIFELFRIFLSLFKKDSIKSRGFYVLGILIDEPTNTEKQLER